MNLQELQEKIADGVKNIPLLAGLPVCREDLGNVIENVQTEVAKTNFCVVVGAVGFNDKAPDSKLCFGSTSAVVTVFEYPLLNRKVKGRPTYLMVAQAIAKEMKLFNTGDGLLVTKTIGKPNDLGGGVISCDVTFDIDTTL